MSEKAPLRRLISPDTTGQTQAVRRGTKRFLELASKAGLIGAGTDVNLPESRVVRSLHQPLPKTPTRSQK